MRYVLISDEVRGNAIAAVRYAPENWVVDIREEHRSSTQNALFWSLMGDLSRLVPFAGIKRNAEDWRTLILSGFLNATGRRVNVEPGIEGEPVALGLRSSRLSMDQMSEVIAYAQAKLAEFMAAAEDTGTSTAEWARGGSNSGASEAREGGSARPADSLLLEYRA